VLLLDGDRAKLCDFGISKVTQAEAVPEKDFFEIGEQTQTLGTVPWMAPEFIDKRIFVRKSDSYSFGILLWELVS